MEPKHLVVLGSWSIENCTYEEKGRPTGQASNFVHTKESGAPSMHSNWTRVPWRQDEIIREEWEPRSGGMVIKKRWFVRMVMGCCRIVPIGNTSDPAALAAAAEWAGEQ